MRRRAAKATKAPPSSSQAQKRAGNYRKRKVAWRGLELAIRYSAYGYVDRSRPTAINSVARLAKHDRDKAVNFLLGLLGFEFI